jgi:hypothetical protein
MSLPRVVVLAAASAAIGGISACDQGEEPVVDAAPPVLRTVSASWKMVDPNGAELTCDAVGGRVVTVTFFRPSTGQGFTEVFDCFRKSGSRALEDGEYSIGFELADGFGTLTTLPSRRYQVTGDMTLEEATFRIDPVGDLAFTLDTGLPASCGGTSLITSMTISLFHADGTTCEPATLTIDPATPYTVNCAAPPAAACIEKDRRITGTRLPAGEYRLLAVALQGADTCWVHDQRVQVRAAGLARSLVLPLMKTCN